MIFFTGLCRMCFIVNQQIHVSLHSITVGGSPRRVKPKLQFFRNSTELTMNVDHEVQLLKEEIKRLGKSEGEGKHEVTFGVLFNDDRCANIFEALVGTLRAAKRKKIITYDGELLLQGVHDSVVITLLQQ